MVLGDEEDVALGEDDLVGPGLRRRVLGRRGVEADVRAVEPRRAGALRRREDDARPAPELRVEGPRGRPARAVARRPARREAAAEAVRGGRRRLGHEEVAVARALGEEAQVAPEPVPVRRPAERDVDRRGDDVGEAAARRRLVAPRRRLEGERRPVEARGRVLARRRGLQPRSERELAAAARDAVRRPPAEPTLERARVGPGVDGGVEARHVRDQKGPPRVAVGRRRRAVGALAEVEAADAAEDPLRRRVEALRGPVLQHDGEGHGRRVELAPDGPGAVLDADADDAGRRRPARLREREAPRRGRAPRRARGEEHEAQADEGETAGDARRAPRLRGGVVGADERQEVVLGGPGVRAPVEARHHLSWREGGAPGRALRPIHV